MKPMTSLQIFGSILIIPSHLDLDLPKSLRLPHQIRHVHHSSLLYMPNAPSIAFFTTHILGKNYKLWSSLLCRHLQSHKLVPVGFSEHWCTHNDLSGWLNPSYLTYHPKISVPHSSPHVHYKLPGYYLKWDMRKYVLMWFSCFQRQLSQLTPICYKVTAKLWHYRTLLTIDLAAVDSCTGNQHSISNKWPMI